MLKLSFILPCYNVERYIADCLNSIYAQDLSEDEFEVICVNDCSTDGTRDIIAEYASRHSNLALIDHSENLTAGGARNTGINAALGEYIWFVDPDDVIKPNCIERLYGIAKREELDVMFFNFDDADESLRILREDRTYPEAKVCNGQEYVLNYFKGNFSVFGIVWRALYRTAFLKESNLQYPIMRKSQDVIFLWRVMLCARRVASLNDAFYVYRSNPYSVMKQQTRARVAFSDRILRGYEIDLMLNNYEVLPPLAENMRRAVKWCANSSIELLKLMPKEEKMLYYDEIVNHREAVKAIKPYMNRKYKLLYNATFGKRLWVKKAECICRCNRKR